MKILLVDDHQLVREGLRALVATLEYDGGAPVEFFEASGYLEALDRARDHPDFDVVMLDLRLPDAQGFAALIDLQERCPGTPVIVISGSDDAATIRGALDSGARGFIPKASPSATVIQAIRLVLSGGTYVPVEALAGEGAAHAATHAAPVLDAEALGLTPRQGEVMQLLLRGCPNKLICRELDLSEGTVKNHLAAIFRALNVNSRVQAVIEATRRANASARSAGG